MIEPPPASSIAGIPYLQPNATPLTLIASVVSQIEASVVVDRPVVGEHHAGVVVEDVQAAETFDGGRDHRARVVLVRDVGVHVGGLAAGGRDLGGGGLAGVVRDVGQHHAGALRGEELRGDHAHAARAAGDERDLALEPTHRSSSRRRARSIPTRSVTPVVGGARLSSRASPPEETSTMAPSC